MVFAGVVPGRRGAVATLSRDLAQVSIHPCPLDASGEHDFAAMADLGRTLLVDALVVVERPAAGGGSLPRGLGPTTPATSPLDFVEPFVGYGAWRGILGSLGVVPALATRDAWRAVMLCGVDGGREAEIAALGQLLPGHPVGELVGPAEVSTARAAALYLAYYAKVLWRLGKFP